MLPRALVQHIVAMRRERGKPLTATAGEILARALRKFPDPVAAAREMIERGWLTINARWPSQQQRTAKPPQHAQSPPAADVDRERGEWDEAFRKVAKRMGAKDG